MSLRDAVAQVVNEYPQARTGAFGRKSPFWPTRARLEAAVAGSLDRVGPSRCVVRARFGMGAWAKVPLVAVMDPRETSACTVGVYVTYLFAADGSGVYLSLNQGSGDLLLDRGQNALPALRARARRLRGMVGTIDGFDERPMDLRVSPPTNSSRAYVAGSAWARWYARETLPSEEALVGDLERLVAAYRRVVPVRF